MPPDDLPAADQYPIFEPEVLREYLALSRIPRGSRPGEIVASITVDLTATQAQLLEWRGKRRGLTGEAAIKRAIESLISQDVSASHVAIARHCSPWFDLVKHVRLGPQMDRLRQVMLDKWPNDKPRR